MSWYLTVKVNLTLTSASPWVTLPSLVIAALSLAQVTVSPSAVAVPKVTSLVTDVA